MQLFNNVATCGAGPGIWPKREGEVWWSLCPTAPLGLQPKIPTPVTDQQLEDWCSDTVGWAAVEFNADAFLAAKVHPSQVRPLVQAAFEAAARLKTPKCRFKQVDIDQQMAKCISTALAAYPNITTLVLQELNIYDEAVTVLASGLLSSDTLSKLVLHGADLSAPGWESVSHALAASNSIKHLKIRGILPKQAITCIYKALKHNTVLQALDLSHHPLGNQGVTKLCDALANSGAIRILKLEDCGIGAQDVHGICKAIRICKNLTHLNISHNPLKPQGCLEVARAVSSSTSLQHLLASHTEWDDPATQQLCASLIHCTRLHALDLSYCNITYKGSHVLSTVATMVPLTVVKLSGNCDIGSQGIQSWSEVIATPKRPLSILSLNDCQGKDDAAFSLATALCVCPEASSLEVLDVASNHFTSKGVGALIRSARASISLRRLDVSFNWLGPRAMSACIKTPRSTNSPKSSFTSSALHQQPAYVRSDSIQSSSKVTAFGPTHTCEIRSEVLPEFREIERVKYKWAQPKRSGSGGGVVLQPFHQQQDDNPFRTLPDFAMSPSKQQTQAQPSDNPFAIAQDNDERKPAEQSGQGDETGHDNPFRTQASEQSSGQVGGEAGNSWAFLDASQLRPGYALPTGLVRAASSPGDSECTAGTISTETNASSGTVDSQFGTDHYTESNSRYVRTGHPMELQLDALQDGTINSQLPVSFAARQSDEQPQPLEPSTLGAHTLARLPVSHSLRLPAPQSPPPLRQKLSVSVRSYHMADDISLVSKPSQQLEDDDDGDLKSYRNPNPSRELTAANVARLNHVMQPLEPGELLLMASRRHDIHVAVNRGTAASTPSAGSQPNTPKHGKSKLQNTQYQAPAQLTISQPAGNEAVHSQQLPQPLQQPMIDLRPHVGPFSTGTYKQGMQNVQHPAPQQTVDQVQDADNNKDCSNPFLTQNHDEPSEDASNPFTMHDKEKEAYAAQSNPSMTSEAGAEVHANPSNPFTTKEEEREDSSNHQNPFVNDQTNGQVHQGDQSYSKEDSHQLTQRQSQNNAGSQRSSVDKARDSVDQEGEQQDEPKHETDVEVAKAQPVQAAAHDNPFKTQEQPEEADAASKSDDNPFRETEKMQDDNPFNTAETEVVQQDNDNPFVSKGTVAGPQDIDGNPFRS